MQGEMDTFPFVLAQDLGRTLEEVGAMPNREYVAWRAYYTYHAAMAKLQKG